MPDYKKQLKHAVYADNLSEEKRNKFFEMMLLLKDKTPDQYIADMDKKIEHLETASNEANDKYEEKKDAIETEYDDSATELFSKWHNASLEMEAPAEALQLAAETIYRDEVSWGTAFKNEKGLSEVYAQIQAEIKAAKEKGQELKVDDTKIYKSYDYYHQGHIAAYQSHMDMFDFLAERKPEVGKAIKENLSEYKNNMAKLKQTRDEKIVQMPEKEESKNLENEIKNCYSLKEDMIKFKDGPYKSMDSITAEDISKRSQSNALDMLTKARAEYRNNCNWWERIWANILPSSRYGPSKYVEKINEYKSALSEMGFTDKQIENADPTKDKDYVKSKANGKYLKVDNLNNKIEENKPEDNLAVENNKVQFILDGQIIKDDSIVPINTEENKTKQQEVRQQPKEMIENLANITSDNKGDVVTQKVENNNNVMEKNGPQIGGKNN